MRITSAQCKGGGVGERHLLTRYAPYGALARRIAPHRTAQHLKRGEQLFLELKGEDEERGHKHGAHREKRVCGQDEGLASEKRHSSIVQNESGARTRRGRGGGGLRKRGGG